MSSTFVKPDKYLSTSSHSPACAWTSKYFILIKKKSNSCPSLRETSEGKGFTKEGCQGKKTKKVSIGSKSKIQIQEKEKAAYLWTLSLNFFLIEELQDEEDKFSTEKTWGEGDLWVKRMLTLSLTHLEPRLIRF